jgi:hypothetical protein
MLQALEIPYKLDNNYLRVQCPLPHLKESSRPSGSFHRETGRYYCFSCKESAKSVEDFLSTLDMLTRYKLKKHPDQAIPMNNMLAMVPKALEALNTSQATQVSTAI